MDVCPFPTDRRVSSINATRIVPVPHPGLNPDRARPKRFISSGFSPSSPLASSCRSFLGNWKPSWMLVRKNSSLQGRSPQGWVTVNSQHADNSRLVYSDSSLSRLPPSGLGCGAILDRWHHQEARQCLWVKSRTNGY